MKLGILKKVTQNLSDDADIEIRQTSDRHADLLINDEGEIIALTEIDFFEII